MKQEPDTNHPDPRAESVSSIWWGAIGVLIVAVVVGRYVPAALVFAVVAGATVATIAIWNSGGKGGGTSEREAELEKKVATLEERLADVETLSAFELRMAAEEKERRHPGSSDGESAPAEKA